MSDSKVLAIDYGQRHVGVAVSQGNLAEPLVVLTNNAKIFDQLTRLCLQHSIDQIIVGLSEGLSAIRTQEFTKQLKEKIDLPIEFVDETLTTVTVQTKLAARRKPWSQRSRDDHYAAAEMLQEWLDERAVMIYSK